MRRVFGIIAPHGWVKLTATQARDLPAVFPHKYVRRTHKYRGGPSASLEFNTYAPPWALALWRYCANPLWPEAEWGELIRLANGMLDIKDACEIVDDAICAHAAGGVPALRQLLNAEQERRRGRATETPS